MSSGTGYRPALDGLRAFAVTAVMLTHSWGRWTPGGYVGVDLFFALSGYLITTLLLAEHEEHGRIDWLRFAGRRSLRLLPALALMLTVVGIVLRPPLAHMLLAGFYVANWYEVLHGSMGPLDPTWSLSVEEQFYLVWPALFVLLPHRRRGRLQWRIGVVAALGCVVALLARFLVSGNLARTSLGTDTRMDSVLFGCLLAVILASTSRRPPAVACRWAFLGAAAALAALLPFDLRLQPLAYTATAIIASVMVAALVIDQHGLPTAVLTWRPVQWVGRVSYGVYLWHFPLQYIVNDLGTPLKLRFPVVWVSAVAVASVSYLLVERPIQRRLRPYVTVPVEERVVVPQCPSRQGL